jgi:phage terminase large subunit GpA-like protein
MDCMSSRSTVRDVVLMWPIQFGKTEVAINVVGYTMAHDPGPIMVCLPGEVSLQKWADQKLGPMLEETPAVRELLTSTVSRESANRRDFKDFVEIETASQRVGVDHMQVRVIAVTKPVISECASADELLAYCARVSNPANQANTETAPRLAGYAKLVADRLQGMTR